VRAIKWLQKYLRSFVGNGGQLVEQTVSGRGEDPEVFGARLRDCREAAGLSQQVLAERCGLSVRTLSNLECGHTRWPYRDSLHRLADGLGLRGKARADFIAVGDRRRGSARTSAAPDDSHGPGKRAVPRLLPAAVPAFAGRQSELAALSRMLDQPGGSAVVTAIGGLAGVGKTTLAVHWAHQVAGEFPDGQLFVNLRGFDPSGTPVMPADALPVLLEALDVPADQLPGTVEAQLGLYRSLLAGKRMLVVLDNAHSEAQVRPLLPGAPTCRVVITSRNRLPGLAATESARLLLLDVLTDAEASELLDQRIGADRIAADPHAARQLIASCAHLPLALSIVAARAAMRQDVSLAQLAADLGSYPDLDGYTTGADAATDIRTVLSWSYRQLNAEAARTFRLAGLHTGQDLDVHAVAALTGMTLSQASHVLGTLAGECLIQSVARDRYRMHDLLRRYARELTDAEDTGQDRQRALTRLLDYYLRGAADAMDAAFPDERHRRPRIAAPAVPAAVMPDKDAALIWLNTERPALIAAVVYAADNGWHTHATHLAAILYRYLDAGGYTADAITVHGNAARVARRSEDHLAEANAVSHLGAAYLRQGHYQSAAGHFQQAIAIYCQSRDRLGEARAITNLGLVELQQGQLKDATIHIERAIALFRDIGARADEPNALTNLGIAEHRQGHFERAMEHVQQALAVCREIGDTGTEAHALATIGSIHTRQGRYARAAAVLRQALALARQTGDRATENDILNELGLAELRQGQHQQAAHTLQHALELATSSGSLSLQAQVLNSLGEAHLCAALPADARARYGTALDVASGTGAKREQARAHHGLGQTYHDCGDTRNARRHWREAFTLYTELGAPEADLIRTRLAGSAARRDPTR
jgi:tetratricopeptide (TPR) repeat protein/transcriptional regulator with XRE-family HTH domain